MTDDPRPATSFFTWPAWTKGLLTAVTGLGLLIGGFWLGNHYQLLFSGPTADNRLPSVRLIASGDSVLASPLLTEVKDLLETKYLRRSDLSQQKLVYGAISGMVAAAGDPYTSFFDPDQNKQIENQLSGSYQGIGAQLGYKDQQMVVVAPLKDSPALAAGIKAGDSLLKVGSKSSSDLSLDQAVALIRGKAGTTIQLTLAHQKSDNPYTVTITRQNITIKSIDLTFKDNPATGQTGDIAYLKLNRFGDTTIQEWDQAVSQIKSHHASRLILDLRDNPGGYLQAAIHIASEFLPDGKIVGEQDAAGNQQFTSVDHQGQLLTMPVVVLINGGSASASEIVSGALHSRQRATLIGENSFGKGSVQEVDDLPQGTSLHVTIAKWLLPDGKNIDKVGIKPDQEVKLTDDDISAGRDPQLDAAITAIAKK